MERVERNHYFDNMKALLIFLVVLGHAVSAFNDTGGPVFDWVYRCIFSFHMPVFIFVSGYFASPNPKKVIARMLPLYLVFQIIQIFMKWMMDFLENPADAQFEFQLFEPAWTLWYLMALMIYSLILPVLDTDNFKKQIRNLVIVFAGGLLIGFTVYTHNFMAISRVVSFLPFYLLGYYGNKNHRLFPWILNGHNRKRKVYYIYRVAAILGMAVLLLMFALKANVVQAKWFYGLMSYQGSDLTIWIKIFTYLISCAWLVILLILTPIKRIPLVDKIGQNTLGIYLFHTIGLLLLQISPVLKERIDGSLAVVILVAVGLTLLLSLDFFSKILRKIRIPYGE